MTSFWIVALLMSAMAAAFVLLPLVPRKNQSVRNSTADRAAANIAIYRIQLAELEAALTAAFLSQTEFEQQKNELEIELLDAVETSDDSPDASDPGRPTRLPLIFAALVPLIAVFLYADWGLSLGSINDLLVAEDLQAINQDGHNQGEMSDITVRLQERLADQPENDEGWYLLARSLTSMSKFEEAIGAYDHLLTRYPQDARLRAYKAEIMYLADGRRVTDRVREAIDVTLTLAPDSPSVLELLAMDAFTKGDFTQSIATFERVLSQQIEPERAAQINEVVARARSMMADSAPALDNGTALAASKDGANADASSAELNILVELADGIEADAGDAVFVFARAVSGPPMPLAVSRLKVSDLPTIVKLNDSMSMVQGMNLSVAGEVQVVARVSKSGQPTAQPGDWEAQAGPVIVAEATSVIKLVIASQLK